MKILLIGGTGNLSREAALAFRDRGDEVSILTRARKPELIPTGVESLVADARDPEAVNSLLGRRRFDTIIDFISYTPADLGLSLGFSRERCGQYLFLSTASAYEKPPRSHLITESTPLGNPYWAYSRAKIECESFLAAEAARGLPLTVVRPSHTYGRGWVPTPFGSADFTIASRMLAGREVVVPGDGQALWTLTHASDFAAALVGLSGNPKALGVTVQVMGHEAYSWDEVYSLIAELLGVKPRLVHVPLEIIALAAPAAAEKLYGDKGWTALFDTSLLESLVPGFRARVSLREGLRDSLDWLLADPSRPKAEPATDAAQDAILAAWRAGLSAAKSHCGRTEALEGSR